MSYGYGEGYGRWPAGPGAGPGHQRGGRGMGPGPYGPYPDCPRGLDGYGSVGAPWPYGINVGADDDEIVIADEEGADFVVPVEAVTSFIEAATEEPSAAAAVVAQRLGSGGPRRDPALMAKVRALQSAARASYSEAKAAPRGSPEAKEAAKGFFMQLGQMGLGLVGNLLGDLANKGQAKPLGPTPVPQYTPPAQQQKPGAQVWKTTVQKAAPVGAVLLIAALGIGAMVLAKKGSK